MEGGGFNIMKDYLNKYLMHSLAGAIVGSLLTLALMRSCAPDPVGTTSSTVDVTKQSHAEETKDSSHTEKNTRIEKTPVAPGKLDRAVGVPIVQPQGGANFPTVECASYGLPETLIPGDDFTSFYTLSIDSTQPSTRLFFGIHVKHSALLIPVTDSSKYTLHVQKTADTSSHEHDHDSTATIRESRLYTVEALLSTPVFHNGAFQLSSLETMAALRVNLYLGEVLVLGLRPELPLLDPFSMSRWKANLDVAFVLKTAHTH
jgi:hypothetical protein